MKVTQITVLILSLLMSACADSDLIMHQQTRIADLQLEIEQLQSELVEKEKLFTSAAKKQAEISKSHTKKVQVTLAKMRKGLAEIDADKAESKRINEELDEAESLIEESTKQWQSRKLKAMLRQKEFRSFLSSFDPEWAFLSIEEIEKKWHDHITKITAENKRLRKEISDLKTLLPKATIEKAQ